MEHREHISPPWFIFRHPKDVSQEVQLMLPYSVDKRSLKLRVGEQCSFQHRVYEIELLSVVTSLYLYQ